MKMITDYLRLILFLGGALIGVQLPSFVDLYEQRLESHLIESRINLGEFQNDADNYFNGDLQQLVRHYKSKSDPIIVDGGSSIAALVERNLLLDDALNKLQRSSLSRYQYSLIQPLAEIQAETLDAYDYSIKLNLQGISWALACGFVISLLIECLLLLFAVLSKRLFRRPETTLLKE